MQKYAEEMYRLLKLYCVPRTNKTRKTGIPLLERETCYGSEVDPFVGLK